MSRTGSSKDIAMWILESSGPDERSLKFRLGPGAVKTLGRAPRSDFIVDAALVSRLHCRLTATNDQLEVVDLASTNGTNVNGQRVKAATLAAGDRLRVGRVQLTVARQT
jgi:pSer/pThr/pTyr-binding forkhead associated (FHA) protein